MYFCFPIEAMEKTESFTVLQKTVSCINKFRIKSDDCIVYIC